MDSVELDNNNTKNSISVLRETTKTTLSSMLNPVKLLGNDKGVPRYWRGLAELCGLDGNIIQTISNDPDPTSGVLKWWRKKSLSDATVQKLIEYLENLDRTDVVDDILPLIAEDLKYKNERPSENASALEDDLDEYYDAFILFTDEDINFATEVIDNMEKRQLTFYVKERDLKGGAFEHDAVIKVISERCNRVIVILSEAFLNSNAHKFFYSLAQSISIEQRTRKIIPCLYTECSKLPPEFDCYFKLDFRRTGTFWDFWDKLYDSIKVPDKPRPKLSLPENSLFREANSRGAYLRNQISRSASSSTQHLSDGLKSSMHIDSSSHRSIAHVRFSNSSDKNLENMRTSQESISPSTSAKSSEDCQDKGVKKSFSIKEHIRRFIPKKAEKSQSPVEQRPDLTQMSIENSPDSIESPIIEDKSEVEKKKWWKRKKRKAVLAT